MNTTRDLPRFVRDLLSSPPQRGEGLNRWLFRVARVLHAFRSEVEIGEILRAATAGEPIAEAEIARAIERSKTCAFLFGRARAGGPVTMSSNINGSAEMLRLAVAALSRAEFLEWVTRSAPLGVRRLLASLPGPYAELAWIGLGNGLDDARASVAEHREDGQ